jgi:hypothetical protein
MKIQLPGCRNSISHQTFHNTSGLACENGRGESKTNHDHDVMDDSISQYAFMQSV